MVLHVTIRGDIIGSEFICFWECTRWYSSWFCFGKAISKGHLLESIPSRYTAAFLYSSCLIASQKLMSFWKRPQFLWSENCGWFQNAMRWLCIRRLCGASTGRSFEKMIFGRCKWRSGAKNPRMWGLARQEAGPKLWGPSRVKEGPRDPTGWDGGNFSVPAAGRKGSQLTKCSNCDHITVGGLQQP